MQIPHNSPQKFHKSCEICIIHLPTIHYVSDACPGRELSEIPANQVKFTPFAHKFPEFCTKIHPHLVHYFQIDREPQKIGVNQPDFMQFAHSPRELHKIC